VWAVPEVGENRQWVDGILKDIPVPVVFLTMQSRAGISTVSIDNYAGGVLATQHLLEQGYHQIGHISGPLDWWEARQRKQAWQDILASVGIEKIEGNCVEGNWSSSSGEAAFDQLLESYPEMDAVFVANDQMAFSVLRTAHRRGIQVPESLGVVGFDNLTESAYLWPALTTIKHEHQELGCRAVEEAVKQIEAFHNNEKKESQNIVLSVELIVRESSVVGK
jgi:DNA-binding LacI/PurR family transcriptional regulator